MDGISGLVYLLDQAGVALSQANDEIARNRKDLEYLQKRERELTDQLIEIRRKADDENNKPENSEH